ncbi:MAG: hypothetical protein IT380_23245 [Myxococcales bacterium]|nr:hypothetical protein [Myxococcales bacterium]
MPTTVSRNAPVAAASRPVAPHVVVPKLMENDPAQRAQVSPSGLITVSGVASNRGIIASFLKLEFEGKSVSIGLSGGQSPRATFEKLEKAMPNGYRLERQAVRAFGDTVAFRIVKDTSKSNVAAINAAFSKALKKTSTAGDKVGVGELRAAVKVAEKDGMTAADKDALARNWAGLFTGAGFRATPAAQKEYAKLQEKLDLPVYPVR